MKVFFVAIIVLLAGALGQNKKAHRIHKDHVQSRMEEAARRKGEWGPESPEERAELRRQRQEEMKKIHENYDGSMSSGQMHSSPPGFENGPDHLTPGMVPDHMQTHLHETTKMHESMIEHAKERTQHMLQRVSAMKTLPDADKLLLRQDIEELQKLEIATMESRKTATKDFESIRGIHDVDQRNAHVEAVRHERDKQYAADEERHHAIEVVRARVAKKLYEADHSGEDL